ncbi:MAG: 30S ribosomal protein S16 [Candidatus Niyogibacteria bacterium]|nr:30S ribosomal protein S16 [Candidatus Niyogibacteria bacterium]
MLVMRFQRVGRKNDPSFRVVVTQKERSAKAGRFVELVGSYNPRTKAVDLKTERIQYWLGKGVQPSATVHNLLVSKTIISGSKIHVSRSSKKAAPAQKPAEAAAPAAV